MLIKIRAYIPEIFFGILLAVAVFAMGMVFQSSRTPPENQTKQSANESSAPIGAEHSPDKLTDWLLVALNFFLVTSTFMLWRSSDKLWRAAIDTADRQEK